MLGGNLGSLLYGDVSVMEMINSKTCSSLRDGQIIMTRVAFIETHQVEKITSTSESITI